SRPYRSEREGLELPLCGAAAQAADGLGGHAGAILGAGRLSVVQIRAGLRGPTGGDVAAVEVPDERAVVAELDAEGRVRVGRAATGREDCRLAAIFGLGCEVIVVADRQLDLAARFVVIAEVGDEGPLIDAGHTFH